MGEVSGVKLTLFAGKTMIVGIISSSKHTLRSLESAYSIRGWSCNKYSSIAEYWADPKYKNFEILLLDAQLLDALLESSNGNLNELNEITPIIIFNTEIFSRKPQFFNLSMLQQVYFFQGNIKRLINFTTQLSQTDKTASSQVSPLNQDSLRKCKTALLIDDDKGVLSVVSEMLKHIGYEVHPFSNPLELLDNHPYLFKSADLLVIDISMPSMNGVEFVEHVRAVNNSIQTVCMTGYDKSTLLVKDLYCDQLTYIKKPFTQDLLSSIVTHMLSQEVVNHG
jgi:CheY-like chemotaxis protein